MRILIPILAACGLALGAGSARADATIDYVREGDCPLPMDALRISGSQLRFDTAQGSGLYDGLDDTVVYLDHERRSFHTMEVDADAAEYTADVASSTLKYADRELAKAQKQIEQMCADARAGGSEGAVATWIDAGSASSENGSQSIGRAGEGASAPFDSRRTSSW